MRLRLSFPGPRRPYGIAVLVLLVGASVNVALYQRAVDSEHQRSAEDLANDAAVLVDRLTKEIRHGVDRVVAVQGLYEASQEVTEVEFHAFVGRLGEAEGVASIGFAPLVSGGELASFEAATRLDHEGYAVYERDAANEPTALQPRDEYFPIVAEALFGELPLAVGFDLASDPVRAAAIAEARQRDDPVLSGFVTLPGDEGVGDMKVFGRALGPDGRFVGMVFAALQADELLDSLVRKTLDESIRWKLTDISEGDDEVVAVRLATKWVDVIDVGDRRLLLTIEEEDAPAPEADWYRKLLGLGLLSTGLLAVLSFLVGRSVVARRELGRLRELTVAKDRFLAGVSHELRTPVTSVLGLAGVLAKDWRDLPVDEVQECLDLIEQEGVELADLVDDLLTVERVASGTLTAHLQLVELDHEMKRVISRLLVPTGREVRVASTLEGLGRVWADPVRVRQILRNLYGNALRYSHSHVEIAGHRQGDRVELSIRNDGPPITEEMRRRLFQPYLEGKAPGQPASIGLGLWVSRTLAHIMHGDLAYNYAHGASIFTLTLPAERTGASTSAEVLPSQTVAASPIR